jgi:hypothetical protein
MSVKLTDDCPICIEQKPSKEYQKIPETLCPCEESSLEKEPPKPTIIKVTEFCLREYLRNAATSKFCKTPPRGCS